MAQTGMFRNSIGGFNKQDVLRFIDTITAEWQEERLALEQTITNATTARDSLQSTVNDLQNAAVVAIERQQVAERQLAEAQQKLQTTTADLSVAATTIEELAGQLDQSNRRLTLVEQELAAATTARDTSIAALADAKAQLTENETTAAKLVESRHQVQQQNEQIAAMQQAISRYQKVLGDAETAQQRADQIVRPMIEQANRQADEALDSIQAVLAGMLAQLGELQGNLEQRRQALRRCKNDSDSRLSAAFGDWMTSSQTPPTAPHHFFR